MSTFTEEDVTQTMAAHAERLFPTLTEVLRWLPGVTILLTKQTLETERSNLHHRGRKGWEGIDELFHEDVEGVDRVSPHGARLLLGWWEAGRLPQGRSVGNLDALRRYVSQEAAIRAKATDYLLKARAYRPMLEDPNEGDPSLFTFALLRDIFDRYRGRGRYHTMQVGGVEVRKGWDPSDSRRGHFAVTYAWTDPSTGEVVTLRPEPARRKHLSATAVPFQPDLIAAE